MQLTNKLQKKKAEPVGFAELLEESGKREKKYQTDFRAQIVRTFVGVLRSARWCQYWN